MRRLFDLYFLPISKCNILIHSNSIRYHTGLATIRHKVGSIHNVHVIRL